MLKRQIQALAGGIVVGTVIQESVWLALNALLPGTDLNLAMLERDAGGGWLLPLLAAWLFGGVAAGLMATLIARGRITGHLAGAALACSATMLLVLAWSDADGMLALAATPSLGAALGAGAGARLVGSDRVTETC